MRTFAGLMLFVVSAGTLFADTWKVQHLAYQGGTRALVVAKNEKQSTEAFVRNQERLGIRIGCRKRGNVSKESDVTTYIAIGNGEPFSGSTMEIEAVFGNEHAANLGVFRYSRGAYWASLSPQHIVWFAVSETITIQDTISDFGISYSLEGAREALKEISCEGETS